PDREAVPARARGGAGRRGARRERSVSPRAYPPPPWRTSGWALFVPYRVRAADVIVPDGFELEAALGWTLGLLGVVDYRPPSPLTYRELVWMPARVRARRADGKIA